MLAWLTLTEVVAGFAVSALITRFPDRRVPLLIVLLMLLAGLMCLVFSPEPRQLCQHCCLVAVSARCSRYRSS
jgi:cyanate permease